MTRAAEDRLTGIVLAGGQSSRMGEDKAALVWKGRTLLARAEATLMAAGCSSVLVSGRPDLPNGFADSQAQAGPAHALLDALAYTEGTNRGLLVIPVDMPLLQPDDLIPLASRSADHACAWQDHPLPLFLPATAVSQPRDDVWSIRKLIARLRVEWLQPDASRTARLRNINTPEDFASLPSAD